MPDDYDPDEDLTDAEVQAAWDRGEPVLMFDYVDRTVLPYPFIEGCTYGTGTGVTIHWPARTDT